MREARFDELIVASLIGGVALERTFAAREPASTAALGAHGLRVEEWFRLAGGYGYRVRRKE